MQDAAPKPPETKKPKKPTVKYVDLPIVPLTPSMTKSELDGAHEIEVSLEFLQLATATRLKKGLS